MTAYNDRTDVFCQPDELNGKIGDVISEAIDFLTLHLQTLPIAIILTGSFARGEGSVYQDGEKLVILGDMEFLVCFKAGIKNIALRLEKLSRDFTFLLERQKIFCKIDFGYCTEAFFERAKQTIFCYELKEKGKVIWGQKRILDSLAEINSTRIHPIDGFFLTCNRMVEQLKHLDFIYDKRLGLSEEAAYGNIKVLLDIPTAILCTTKRFVPGYEKRLQELKGGSSAVLEPIFPNAEQRDRLLREIEGWTHYKLFPSPIEDIYHRKFPEWAHLSFDQKVLLFWLKLVPVVKAIWIWQLRVLNNANSSNRKAEQIPFDLILKTQTKREIIKGWAKLMKEILAQKEKADVRWWLFPKGSPRHLIYKSASHLYFFYVSLLFDFDSVESKNIGTISQSLPLKLARDSVRARNVNDIRVAVCKNWDLLIK